MKKLDDVIHDLDELDRNVSAAITSVAKILSTASAGCNERYEAVVTLSSWNGQRVQSRSIWNHVIDLLKSRIADDEFVEFMIVGFVEPATEVPIYYHDMEQMSRMLSEPELSIIVFSAFDREEEGFPQNMKDAFDAFNAFRKLNNEPPAEINTNELDSYMKHMR